MSLLIAEVELRIALARKRLLVLNMLVPLLLGVFHKVYAAWR